MQLLQNLNMADKSLQNLIKKSDSLTMKVTTKISGKTKEQFVNDCIGKEKLECNMAKHIIEVYYQIVPQIPRSEYMEFSEIKKYINDNIKLK